MYMRGSAYTACMTYRMIAIDLDGTLLDRQGRLAPDNLAAIGEAQRAGVLIVPCTGRAWRESRMVTDLLPQAQQPGSPGVFVGGAAVSDLATGATLDISVIEPNLALELIDFLRDCPDAVLVFRDANVTGHDYLVTGRGTLTANTEWWFQATGATVYFQRKLSVDDLHHTLRVALVTAPDRIATLTEGLRASFAGRVIMHSFAAVQMPDPRESVHVLEIFAKGTDKWRGLSWIAEQRGFSREQIAVIGDEINDTAMLEGAGCGIAMGNAIEAIKGLAKHVTLDCDQCGVAHAIRRLLSGEWG
jgi:5-amino-6-(5-phospho-D-ribitylamino)uracil phosphatase